MNELLPGGQAMRLRAGLIDHLTTFALVDSDAQAALRQMVVQGPLPAHRDAL